MYKVIFDNKDDYTGQIIFSLIDSKQLTLIAKDGVVVNEADAKVVIEKIDRKKNYLKDVVYIKTKSETKRVEAVKEETVVETPVEKPVKKAAPKKSKKK